MVVAFTGYRPEKMPFVESKKDEAYLKFRKRQLQVIERLIERGCTHFISGVAMGFDTWVAEDILALQKNNSSLELECAIPFPGQADRWSTSDQKRRYKILTHATSSVIVCEHYSSNCLLTSIRVLPLRLYYTSFQVICEMCKSDVGFVLNRNGAGCLTSIMGRWVIPVLDHISCNRSTTRGEAINFRHIHRPYRTVLKK